MGSQRLPINDRLAQELHGLTALQVSFLTELDDGRWFVSGSTLTQAERDDLPNRITDILRARASDTALPLNSQKFQTRAVTLSRPGAEQVISIWQNSLRMALDPFTELQKTLFDLAIASIFATLFGSIVISQRLVNPINRLVETARRTRDGDYSQKMEIVQQDEIGELALSFDHMRDAISTREQKILRLAYQDTLTSLHLLPDSPPAREDGIVQVRREVHTVVCVHVRQPTLPDNRLRKHAVCGIMYYQRNVLGGLRYAVVRISVRRLWCTI